MQEIIQDRDEERERLRRELQRAQEQVHTLMTQSSVRTSSLSVTSPTSRPASYISIEESSGPEMSERNLESEDDGKQPFFFSRSRKIVFRNETTENYIDFSYVFLI